MSTEPRGHIGKLFLLNEFPKEYGKFCESKWGLDLTRVEKEMFDFSHDELGLRLIVVWPLRDVVKVAVRHHHAPEEAGSDMELVQVLSVSDALSRSAGIGSSSVLDASPFEYAEECLGLNQQDLWSAQEQAFNVFVETKQSFA